MTNANDSATEPMADPSCSQKEVANSIIFFPNDNHHGSSFEEACLLAAESRRPLHLLQDVTHLSDTIKLRCRQHLTVRGCSASQQQKERMKISGKLHSLFLLNNHSRLVLTDIDLIHESPNDDEDCRNVGAAINLRYKGSASVHRSTITSESGFCGWAVQKARMEFRDCTLRAPLRSALVCFGQAHLGADSCRVERAGVHGICARGNCTIHVTRSQILESTVRGLYAYANARVTLEDCTVAGTIRPDMAAIEVSAAIEKGGNVSESSSAECEKASKLRKHNTSDAGMGSTSSLIVKNCRIVDNASAGIRLRGDVHHNDLVNDSSASGNIIARNVGGDLDYKLHYDISEDQLHRNVTVEEAGIDQPRRRDASGSSFRKGDWWCPKCCPKKVVPGSRTVCLACGSQKDPEHLLANEEVMRLNQGRVELSAQNDSATCDAQGGETLQNAVTWWFDGEGGWIPYDSHSSSKLEEVFQLLLVPCDSNEISPIVYLSEGRYRVNVQTMEQINMKTHFPRYVRRK